MMKPNPDTALEPLQALWTLTIILAVVLLIGYIVVK